MARLLWLPEVLRAAGLTVHEYDGWRTRGSDSWGPIRGITIHATAGSSTSTDAGELRVLVTGSTSAPPPIAQLYLSRSGAWWVVASGRCNHNLVGWAGPNKGLGNSALLGIEAQNDNRGQGWPTAQYESYVRGVAALATRLGIPVSRVAGHKEHQPAGYGKASTKTDPTFDMDRFRRAVAAVQAGNSTGGMGMDKVILPAWYREEFPGDPGEMPADKAMGSVYGHSRMSHRYSRDTYATVTALREVIEQLAAAIGKGGGSVDTAAILRGVDERLSRLRLVVDNAAEPG
jgi:hypothetical protein